MLILTARSYESRNIVWVTSDTDIKADYYLGRIEILPVRPYPKNVAKRVHEIKFIPDADGRYYYFTSHKSFPIHGCYTEHTVSLGGNRVLQIIKAGPYAILKRHNYISMEIELVYLRNGTVVEVETITTKPPKNNEIADDSALVVSDDIKRLFDPFKNR